MKLSKNQCRSDGLMQVSWLEQTFADMRHTPDWLSRQELERIAAMRVPKRRHDWQLGRWTAKQAVAAYLGIAPFPAALGAIEIRPADCGAPEVYLDNQRAPVSISISHRGGRAVCATAPFGTSVGCDLEIIEPRCDAFITDYFTPKEQDLVLRARETARFRLLALFWSAKESVLKTLRTGLRLDLRTVDISLNRESSSLLTADSQTSPYSMAGQWHGLSARCSSGQGFRGWWQFEGEIVRTLVSMPHCSSPLRFEVAQNVCLREFSRAEL